MCDTVDAALAACRTRLPSLLVVDGALPAGGAAALCRAARALPGDGMVILAVAAGTEPEACVALLDAGADDVIASPIAPARVEVRLAVAERRAAEVARRRRAAWQLELGKLIVDNSPTMLFRTRAGAGFEFVSENIAKLGYRPADLLSGRVTYPDMLHPDDRDRVLREGAARVERGDHQVHLIYRVVTRSGETRWVDDHTTVERDAEGRPTHFQGILVDITERRDTEEALRAGEERFRRIFEDGPIGMAVIGLDQRFIRVNGTLCRMLGYDEADLMARTFADVAETEDLDTNAEMVARLFRGEVPGFRLEKRYRTRDGGTVWANVTAAMIADADGAPLYAIAMVENITDRKQLEQRLMRQAFFDPLTGLPNRSLFMERLEYGLPAAHRPRSLAVLFLDLDGFKNVNDRFGHEAGDRLLAAVGRRLETCVRSGDIVARFGGDEFTILLERVSGRTAAAHVASRIIDTLRTPFLLDGAPATVSASIGIALNDAPDTHPADLLRRADLALYRAKAGGKSGYVVYTPGIDPALDRFPAAGD